MVTEKQWKIAIILHFSFFCPVVLLICMIERRFKVFSRTLWELYPLEIGFHVYLVAMVTEKQ